MTYIALLILLAFFGPLLFGLFQGLTGRAESRPTEITEKGEGGSKDDFWAKYDEEWWHWWADGK